MSTNHHHFVTWRPLTTFSRDCFPPHLRTWLNVRNSMTSHLRALHQDVTIEVLSHQWQRPQQDELDYFGFTHPQLTLVREVDIICKNTVWMFARTIIPRESLQGRYHALKKLGNQALGEVLFHRFKRNTFARSLFEVTRFYPGHTTYEKATRSLQKKPACVWGRRSLFHLNQTALLLIEVFNPSFYDCGPVHGKSDD